MDDYGDYPTRDSTLPKILNLIVPICDEIFSAAGWFHHMEGTLRFNNIYEDGMWCDCVYSAMDITIMTRLNDFLNTLSNESHKSLNYNDEGSKYFRLKNKILEECEKLRAISGNYVKLASQLKEVVSRANDLFPSSLLAEMRKVATGRLPEHLLEFLFIWCLPERITSVLSQSQARSFEEVTRLADSIFKGKQTPAGLLQMPAAILGEEMDSEMSAPEVDDVESNEENTTQDWVSLEMEDIDEELSTAGKPVQASATAKIDSQPDQGEQSVAEMRSAISKIHPPKDVLDKVLKASSNLEEFRNGMAEILGIKRRSKIAVNIVI